MTQTNTNQPANPSLYERAGGAVDAASMVEVAGTMESFPIYGVQDLVKDQAISGIFLGNQTRGEDDKGVARTVHVLENPKSKEKFGLWERATTARPFSAIAPGTLVSVTYLGQADKHPTDPKKSPPHQFKILAAKA